MPTTDPAVTFAPTPQGRRPGARPRRWGCLTAAVAAVAAVALMAALVWGGVVFVRDGLPAIFGAQRCQATALGTSVDLSPEQMHHAATITTIALARGLPARAASIALATAIQESKLRNITYGDRDSLGLFQQRPSMGWGTRDQVLDPVHATNAFYDALVKIRGWETGNINDVAQAVQRSGHPEAYADHEQEGRILASALAGYSPEGLGCRLSPPAAAGSATQVAAGLRDAGIATGVSASAGVVRTAAMSEQ
uniref:hypothetical protein n=1 Tax=Kribbia dieselivorans TaxID=331526 RepID=UPI000A42DB89